MTNSERQLSLRRQQILKYGYGFACGKEEYCQFCKIKVLTEKNACAKAYNKMIRNNLKEW